MIYIQEQKSHKCVGTTSLFLTFDFNREIIDIIKVTNEAIWDAKKKVWELPLNTLAYLIDNLCLIDDIEITLLEDKVNENIQQIVDHKVKPFKHQEDAVSFLLNNPNSLLLDVPGLGKTGSIIYTCEELKAQKDIKHALIICGINSLKQNWKKEIQKFSNLSCRVIGEKIAKTGKISYKSVAERAKELYEPLEEFFAIINVECLRDSNIIDAIKKSKNNFDVIVLDECHVCAGKSAQSDGLIKLSKVGSYHYGLTGTLLTNSPFNAFVPLKFIGKESTSLSKFKHAYGVYMQNFGHEQLIGYKNLDLLQEEIDSCSLRRTKDLLDLPEKTIIPEYIEMSAEHESFYRNLQAGIVDEADRVDIKNTSLLGLTVRLRQASTCPSTLTSNNYINNKFERAVEIIEQLISNKEKVVVFSQFKDPIYELANKLNKYKPFICTGDQLDSDVSKMVDMFQEDDEHMILLGTSQKMGVGLTLNRASYMILLDCPYTPSQMTQITDRIHRIGTKKPVFIYNLINKGTIDERVQQILERKSAVIDYVLDDKLTEREDLKELIGIKDDNFI